MSAASGSAMASKKKATKKAKAEAPRDPYLDLISALYGALPYFGREKASFVATAVGHVARFQAREVLREAGVGSVETAPSAAFKREMKALVERKVLEAFAAAKKEREDEARELLRLRVPGGRIVKRAVRGVFAAKERTTLARELRRLEAFPPARSRRAKR